MSTKQVVLQLTDLEICTITLGIEDRIYEIERRIAGGAGDPGDEKWLAERQRWLAAARSVSAKWEAAR